jgi:hypothetical protein
VEWVEKAEPPHTSKPDADGDSNVKMRKPANVGASKSTKPNCTVSTHHKGVYAIGGFHAESESLHQHMMREVSNDYGKNKSTPQDDMLGLGGIMSFML